jgi:hypothetical protein
VASDVPRRLDGGIYERDHLLDIQRSAGREPDVVALQEITRRTLPLWKAALTTFGLTHIRASLGGT